MISVKDAVFQEPTFEKTATFEVSKDSSKWHDEILKQFIDQVDYLPKELGIDIVINSMSDNEGYAKGSVVVWFNNKKINFPIIIKNYQLYPFDIFVYNQDGEQEYFPANLNNIRRILFSEKMAKLENRYDNVITQDLKTPGNIGPKQSINLYDIPEGMLEPPYSKMSAWVMKAHKEDLEKLAIQMEAAPGVMKSFVDNTGDLMTNIIKLPQHQKYITPDDHKIGILDLTDVVKAKRAVTVIDSDFFDVNKLIPITPPSVAELRLYEYPSMEDFIESGDSASQRFLATKLGKPVVGVVLDMKDSGDLNMNSDCIPCSISGIQTDKDGKPIVREQRKQIFISIDGKYYSTFDDWDKKGIGFYGSRILQSNGAVELVVKKIAEHTCDNLTNQDSYNRNDGADKIFNPIEEMTQGIGDPGENHNKYLYHRDNNSDILILYGAGDAWEVAKIYGNFKKYMVENTQIYVSKDCALIPAKIASFQKVGSVETPLYKMILGKIKNIYLYPETSIIINSKYMRNIGRDEFMHPDKTVQAQFEDAMINKVAVCLASGSGYKISGTPLKAFHKLAKFNDNSIYTTNQALTVLSVLGMEKDAAKRVLEIALSRYAGIDKTASKHVTVYGVRNDYVSTDLFEKKEKDERMHKLYKEAAFYCRKNLIKEASALSDPEAVDVVLSLNFINEENLQDYIENIGIMKKIIGKLSSILIASRMGLSDINEDAAKKALDGLSQVVEGLENVKIALGK